MALESRDVENINPQRFSKQSVREITRDEKDDDVEDAIDEREIFGRFKRSTVKITTWFIQFLFF